RLYAARCLDSHRGRVKRAGCRSPACNSPTAKRWTIFAIAPRARHPVPARLSQAMAVFMTTKYVADLFSRGVVLQPHEAVAIAQQLIHPVDLPDSWPLEPPTGPPSIGN